jgi:hypothetical protein
MIKRSGETVGLKNVYKGSDQTKAVLKKSNCGRPDLAATRAI